MMTGNHTLLVRESRTANGTVSICACGTSLGFIPAELITAYGLPYYAKHQAQIIQAWLRHRHPYQPKPYWPVECTIRLAGGPRDGQELTIPFHIYRDGYLITLAAPERIRIYADEDTDMVGTLEVEKIIYTRDPGNPLIWKA